MGSSPPTSTISLFEDKGLYLIFIKNYVIIFLEIEKELITMAEKKKKLDKSMFKMSPEELALWMHFRKACSCVENRRGKGSYKRKPKYPDRNE